MKALSIRQPWAWLIVHGFKNVENRTWGTKHRGTILVHTGQTFDHAGHAWVMQRFPDIKMPALGEFDLGGVVGQANLVDCLPPDSHLMGRCNSPWYEGEFGFLIADAMPLPLRPLKGKLHFFEVPDAQ